VHRATSIARVRHVARSAALAALARERVPCLHDIGSGLLADLSPWDLTGEPGVREAIGAGADLVLFSGDKLLGGPQAGCLAGGRELVRRCRGNAFARAARADKLTLAALEATLSLYRDPETRGYAGARDATKRRGLAERAMSAALCPAWAAPRRPGESAVAADPSRGGAADPPAPYPGTIGGRPPSGSG
jgi:L-seryl-tRNA(Ser) seleniumtransferase